MLLFLLLFTSSFMMGATIGTDYIDLKYNFQLGDKHLYRDQLFISLSTDDDEDLIHNQLELIFEYKQEITKIENDIFFLNVTFKDIIVENAVMTVKQPDRDPRTLDMIRRTTSGLKPVLDRGWVRYEIDSKGNVRNEEYSRTVADQLGGGFGQLSQRLAVRLPDTEVRNFLRYYDDLSIVIPEFDIDIKVPVEYFINGRTDYNGEECFIIEARLRGEVELELSENQTGIFNYNGSRRLLFSISQGIILEGTDKQSFKISVFDEDGQQVSFSEGEIEAKTKYLGLAR